MGILCFAKEFCSHTPSFRQKLVSGTRTIVSELSQSIQPSTTISYSLPKTAIVSLRIFNALGQEVVLLVNERKEPGTYQATWNANVPSGIYFYRSQAGEYVETKKLTVLK